MSCSRFRGMAAVLAVLLTFGVGQAFADPMTDDFSTDTSANWSIIDGAGSFTINNGGNGVMEVTNSVGIWNPVVFHNTARLDVGETVGVDMQAVRPREETGVWAVELRAFYDAFGTDRGIRFVRDGKPYQPIEDYPDAPEYPIKCAKMDPNWSWDAGVGLDDPDYTQTITTWVDRTDVDTFEYYVGPIGWRVFWHETTLGGTPPAGGLHVGVSMNPTDIDASYTGVFDNFAIMSIADANLGQGGIPGDFDNSGQIDPPDYEILLEWLFEGTTHAQGDFNLSGFTDLEDFIAFREAYPAVVAAAEAVPEPGTFVLLGLAWSLLFCRRRRQDAR